MKNTKEITKFLLTCGIVAGPIYILVGAAQILFREGFDMTRHPLSLLATGDLGWIQIINFIVTGLLAFAAAIGLHRAVRAAGKRRSLAPLFIGIYGLCVLTGGIFVTDPSLGFPPGTPNTYPETFSWHGGLHFAAGQFAFLSLIIAGFVFGRHFAKTGMPRWALLSRLMSTGFIAAIIFSMVAAGTDTNLALSSVLMYVAVAAGWLWLSAVAARLKRAV